VIGRKAPVEMCLTMIEMALRHWDQFRARRQTLNSLKEKLRELKGVAFRSENRERGERGGIIVSIKVEEKLEIEIEEIEIEIVIEIEIMIEIEIEIEMKIKRNINKKIRATKKKTLVRKTQKRGIDQ